MLPRPSVSAIGFQTAPPPPLDRSVPTSPPGSLRPGFKAPPASDADCSLGGFRAVDCLVRLRVDGAHSCNREDYSDWFDAWRVQPSCPTSRRATLAAHLYPDQDPSLDHSLPSPHRSFAPTLRPDQKNGRPTDKMQLLYPGTLGLQGCRTRARWQPTSTVVACGLRASRGRQASSLIGLWRTSARPLSTIALFLSSTKTPLSAPTRARRCRFPGSLRNSRGPSRVWSSLASSAGPRPVVLLLLGCQHPYQQRVRQAEVCLHRPASPGAQIHHVERTSFSAQRATSHTPLGSRTLHHIASTTLLGVSCSTSSFCSSPPQPFLSTPTWPRTAESADCLAEWLATHNPQVMSPTW